MMPAGSGLPPMIVLAGGLGTRLRGAVAPGLPKVLAPIHGRPFLDYLLVWLAGQQVPAVTFALGHAADAVIEALKAREGSLPIAIDWTVEPQPSGTAGAIALALRGRDNTTPHLVMNGDTLVEASLAAFCACFRDSGAELGMVAAEVPDPGRYGSLLLDRQDRVLRFAEKAAAASAPTWINAGIYLLPPALAERTSRLDAGSFEKDILMQLPAGAIWAWRGSRRFIDIGTRDSLARGQRLLAPLDDAGVRCSIWQ